MVLIGPSWNWNSLADRGRPPSPPVLIGPSWNWNLWARVATFGVRQGFNRTFMELKQIIICFNRTFMELKHIITKAALKRTNVLIGPSWNWNIKTGCKVTSIRCFNRTFMELKHIHAQFRAGKHARFNRTFMELKRKEPVAVDLGECSFNRTFMELKPQYCCVCSYEAICFNRTFMELKIVGVKHKVDGVLL